MWASLFSYISEADISHCIIWTGTTELMLVVIDCYNDVYAVTLGFTGFPRVLQYPVVIQ